MSGAGLKKCSPRQRWGRADPVQDGEELALGADVLDDRLDHELATGEPRELAHERQALERAAPLVLAPLPLLHALGEPALDARACTC